MRKLSWVRMAASNCLEVWEQKGLVKVTEAQGFSPQHLETGVLKATRHHTGPHSRSSVVSVGQSIQPQSVW